MSGLAGPVVIRCDAGPTYGIGHVMRCVALAEELAARGRRIVFVADLDAVDWARTQVLGRGFEHVPPPAAPADEVAALVDLGPAFVVIDSYVLPEDVYAGVRAAGLGVLAIVDGDPAGRPADIWLDQNIGAETDAWPVPDGSVRLAGLDYALMRDDIRALRPAAPERTEEDPPAVFAFFGGTDPFGAAPAVAAAVIDSAVPCSLRIVAAAPELAGRIETLTPAPGQRIEVLPTSSTLAADVRAADVVLSAAGTSSWELLCLGAAAGLVCVAENQRPSYARAVDEGLVSGLGYLGALESGGAAPTGLVDLLTDPALRRRLREQGWSRVDGRGRDRVADACAARFGTDV